MTTTQAHKTNASTSTIQYDHETYLELLAGESNHVEKTASRVYEEVSPFPPPGAIVSIEKGLGADVIGTSEGTESQSAGSGCVVGAVGVGC